MPLDTSRMVFKGHLIHQDVKQYADLLTGIMADQPVEFANALSVALGLYLDSFVQQEQIPTPVPPPTGAMKLYPKTDGNFYKLDPAGLEEPLGVGTEEVFIDPEPPAPRDDYVLWVDTDAAGGDGGGGGDLNYVHTQSAPSAVWVVTHDLGKYPAVDVVDSGGSMVIPDVTYDSDTQVTLVFGSATSGKAYMN